MVKEFIQYEQALVLKKLGFDEPCFGRYIYDGKGKEWFLVQTQQTKSASVIFEGDKSVNGISIAAPLYQQAFRWFREKYSLFYDILQYVDKDWRYTTYSDNVDDFSESGFYNTYEEAELECLKKLIEIVKNK